MEHIRHAQEAGDRGPARLIIADLVAFVTLAAALGLATSIVLAGVALLLATGQGSL